MNTFAIRLNELIKQRKITMYRLANDLGFSKTTISHWCAGNREPKVSDIIKLATYFNVSTDDLLGYENLQKDS